METFNPVETSRALRAMANTMMDDAVALERIADELDRNTVMISTSIVKQLNEQFESGLIDVPVASAGVDNHSSAAVESPSVAGNEPPSGSATAQAAPSEPGAIDPSIGGCPKRDDKPHDFQPMRERDGIYIEKCVSCNMPRWVHVDAPHPRRFNYGPPPPPPRVRIMGPDEELAPGEEFERTDTDVPRIISTPQPTGKRMVNGRVLEYED